MTPLDMYNGLSQVYCIKTEGRIHLYTMGLKHHPYGQAFGWRCNVSQKQFLFCIFITPSGLWVVQETMTTTC